MGLLNKVFGRNQKKVYICCDYHDENFARDICDKLESDKSVSCWLVYRDLDYEAYDVMSFADSFQYLRDKIKESDLFILIYSKYSASSAFDQIDIALHNDVPIIIFRIDMTELDSRLSNHPYIDAFSNFNEMSDELCDLSFKFLNKELDIHEINWCTSHMEPSAESSGGGSGGHWDHIFISYSTRDAEIANRACYFLESNGFECWIAPRNISSGKNYLDEIDAAIDDAEFVLLIASNNSFISKYVRRDIEKAFNSQKTILVFNTDGSLPTQDMESFLKDALWIDAENSTEDGRAVSIVKGTRAILNKEYGNLSTMKDFAKRSVKGDITLTEISDAAEPIPHVDEVPFPAYEGDEPYAFVSYAHKDYKFVFNEIKRFKRQGLNIWYDEGIAPGNEWLAEIGRGLADAKLFIVFISNNSVASKFVRKEITYAINNDIPFIAIHIEETPMPIQLDLALGDLQAILRYGMSDEEYYRRYTKAFNSHLKKYGIRLNRVDEIE